MAAAAFTVPTPDATGSKKAGLQNSTGPPAPPRRPRPYALRQLVIQGTSEGKREPKHVWDLFKEREVNMDALPAKPDKAIGFYGQPVHVYMLTGDYAAAIKPDVQCSELDRYEVAALPTRVSESEDRVIKHQRVRIAMCHLRHMDHPSKRGSELMTAEEAGFVPDSPVKTPPAKRQRTSTTS